MNEKLLSKLYKVETSSLKEFGETEEEVKPSEDTAFKGGKAEFANGKEVAQNFCGKEHAEKMLCSNEKAEEKQVETSAKHIMSIEFTITHEDYKTYDRGIDSVLDTLREEVCDEDSIDITEDSHDHDTEVKIEFELQPGLDEEKVSEPLDYVSEELERLGAFDLKINHKAMVEAYKEPEVCEECHQEPCICEEAKCETSEEEKEFFIIMDEDGKVLSDVDEYNVDFLDTVDDEDGGKARATKFATYEDAEQAMRNVDLKEEDGYQILSSIEAFNFALSAKGNEKELKRLAKEIINKVAHELGYTQAFSMLDDLQKQGKELTKDYDEVIAHILAEMDPEFSDVEVFKAIAEELGENEKQFA